MLAASKSKAGRKDDFGHIQLGGIGKQVAELIKYKTGIETREVVLGHLQRHVAELIRDFNQSVANLKLAYAKAASEEEANAEG